MARELSHREEQVAGLICDGRTNKEIAANLGLTEGTIKVYASKVYAKRGGSRWGLITATMQERIDELEFIRLALMQRVRDLEVKCGVSST